MVEFDEYGVSAFVKIASQKLVLHRVIVVRPRKGRAVLRHFRQIHAKVVGLNPVVALSFFARASGVDSRQKPTGRIAGFDIRVDGLGFSAHNEDVALRLIDEFPFDSVLFPINYV
ncbi:MAG: hypothetical protein U9Q07_13020, partial [Planctomycetota bacterium]|nr:hypothetical protein [Planctomycetota bacterium]